MRCIYCLKDRDANFFSKGEHVVPECLGKFKNNLVLHNIVCDECNQYFGDNLELVLGRDSFPGIARYRFGLKPKNIPFYSRMSFRISGGHELEGLYVKPTYPKGGRENDIELEEQVEFFNIHINRYNAFLLPDIPTKSELERSGYDLTEHAVRIYGNTEEITTRLDRLGIVLKTKVIAEQVIRPDALIPVKVTGRIDRIIARAISKICFNYYTFVMKGKVFQLDYDEIRSFIRYDLGRLDDHFLVSTKPLNVENLKTGVRIFLGHIIFVERKGDAIIGNISLFSSIVRLSYRITFCNKYSGLWFPIKNGSYFDVKNKVIAPLHPMEIIRH